MALNRQQLGTARLPGSCCAKLLPVQPPGSPARVCARHQMWLREVAIFFCPALLPIVWACSCSPSCPFVLTPPWVSMPPAAPVCYCLLSPARPAVLPCGGLQSPCHPPAHPLLCHHRCGLDLVLLLCDRFLSTAWQVRIAVPGLGPSVVAPCPCRLGGAPATLHHEAIMPAPCPLL